MPRQDTAQAPPRSHCPTRLRANFKSEIYGGCRMTAKFADMPASVLLRTVVDPATGCWRWIGPHSPDGYGQGWVNGRTYRMHRWSVEFFSGAIAPALSIDHLCRVRDCLNPDHLEAVTQRVNLMRGATYAARNASAVECIHGHAFDDVNTYVTPRGHRDCRECGRERRRRYRARLAVQP